jgi:transportin-3
MLTIIFVSAHIIIICQLALALADLALQMQSWTTVVSDLIGRFSGDMATVPALLDILIVLPEEVIHLLA